MLNKLQKPFYQKRLLLFHNGSLERAFIPSNVGLYVRNNNFDMQ